MLIKADAILTMAGAVVEPGRMRIDGNRIAEISSDLSSAGEKILDFSQPGSTTVVLPGLIDCHCHLELTGLAGKIKLREGQGLINWLMKLMKSRPKWQWTRSRWVKRGMWAGLAAGTTTAADISAKNQSWRTLIKGPLRKVCFAEVVGLGPKAEGAIENLKERIKSMPDETLNFFKGITPHAPYSTAEQVYRQAMALAEQNRWRLMTHLAEDPAEIEFLQTGKGPFRIALEMMGLLDDRFVAPGVSPVAWAEQLGMLNRRMLLAHVNYIDDRDISLLANGRASVVYCPLAHQYFRHAPHRYREMIEAGVRVVLGSDSLACSPSLSMFDQMRRVYRQGGMSAEEILKMTTIHAAQSLQLSDLVGTLETGRLADFIVLRMKKSDRRDIHASVLDGENSVVAVFVDGKKLAFKYFKFSSPLADPRNGT